jgi:hypothetical protein
LTILEDLIPHSRVGSNVLFHGIQALLKRARIVRPDTSEAELRFGRVVLACLGSLDLASIEQLVDRRVVVANVVIRCVVFEQFSSTILEHRCNVLVFDVVRIELLNNDMVQSHLLPTHLNNLLLNTSPGHKLEAQNLLLLTNPMRS